MPPKRIHFIRHGQGQHNMEPLEKNRLIQDPHLTDLGVQRCKQFNEDFPRDIHIDLVCASPMWRAIQTALYGLHDVTAQTQTKKILLLPDAQETTNQPCDIGSPVAALTKEFGDVVDAHMLTDEWASKKGHYGTDPPTLRARAKALRQWLRARPEKEIAIVSHGAIMDYIVKDNLDDNGVFKGPVSGWTNREWRFYHFDDTDDDEAGLIEEEESLQRRLHKTR